MNRYKLRIPARGQDDRAYHAPLRYLVTYVSAYSAEHAISLATLPRGYRKGERALIEASEVR